jgi:hypothetical protein
MSDDAVTDLTRGVYRRLYSGFITGQRINKLSLQAEAWFWRVLATVDDFGNGHADPDLCRAATVGKRKIPARQISEWLRQMRNVGLIELYTAKGEPFLHVVGFEITQPAGKNGKRLKRYPLPDESDGIQVNPDSSSASDNDTDNDTQDDNDSEPAMPFVSDEFKMAIKDLEKHRKEIRHKLTPTARRLMYAEFAEWGEARSIAAIRLSIRKGWRGVFEGKESNNGNRATTKADGSMAAAERVAAKYERQG